MLNNKPNITVIDAPMGRGKSTAMIHHINENPDENYVVVLPTRSECVRYAEALERVTTVPHLDAVSSKESLLTIFNEAVFRGETIITTHALLKLWDDTSILALRGKNYTLILDEVLEVVHPFPITAKDYNALKAGGIIKESQDELTGLTRVNLTDPEYQGKHDDFIRQVARGNVVRVRDDFCVWLTGAQRLTAFDEVLVLTYNFQGSIMSAWLKLNNLTYNTKSLVNGEFVGYMPEFGFPFRELIDIVQDYELNKIGGRHHSLSSSDLAKAPAEKLKRLRNNIRKFFKRNDAKEPHYNMWTTPLKFKPKLQCSPFGYIGGRVSPNQLRKMKAEERVQRDTHVAYNMKATNLYAHKKYLAYAYNVFPNPALTRLFNECNIPFDRDQYALNELVQWLWRSRIRQGKDITVYIPAKRMRNLLIDWLNTESPADLKTTQQAA
ncbi:MAG: hypothetical protein JAZ11_09915 [Candidatus Thiodiazotropha lotti]|nr:hypothetical protein [Candidatus Thiodiazotropha lotti]